MNKRSSSTYLHQKPNNTQVMPVFNLRAQHANALPPPAVQALTKSIEQTLASYAASTPTPSSSRLLLLPSFTGDFTLPEAGKALALHLVEHMRPLEAEVPLVPDAFRCVSHTHKCAPAPVMDARSSYPNACTIPPT